MIIVRTPGKLNVAMGLINKQINKALKESALRIGQGVQLEAQSLLASRTKTHTGRLGGAILLKPGASNANNFFRYDVIVDTTIAPYAAWIEFGRSSPIGLPYSQKGTKDYSKSRFKGYRYLRDAIKKYSDINEVGTIVGQEVLRSLKGLKLR